MLTDVQQHPAEEACGLVAGRDSESLKVYPVTNDLHSPVRFYMRPLEMLSVFTEIEANGWDVLAIYHSHLNGPPVPSATDIAEFRYPGTLSLIWSPQDGKWACRAFLISGEGYREVTITILG